MSWRDAVSALTYGLVSPKNRAPVQVASGAGNMFGFGSGLGISSELDAMGSVGTLFSIVRLNAQSVAAVDWSLHRVTRDGRRSYGPDDDQRKEVVSHPALNLLAEPNELMTGAELMERTTQFIDLAGEAFWVVDSPMGFPSALWPVRPDRMEEVTNGWELTGWLYKNPDGSKIPFKSSEVIQIKLPNPTNMFRGISPVHALTIDLESTQAAAAYNRSFFRNSARPGGLIEAPGQLTDPEFDRLVEQWREQHRGVRAAHRVGILENGMKWVPTSYSMKDMDFRSLRDLSRELIREAYGIHPHMLGLSESVNRANAEAASVDYARYQLKPRLERIKQALNVRLLPLFGGDRGSLEFCYDNPEPEDRDSENAERDSKVRAAVALIGAGFDPEETMMALGLPDIPHTGVQEPQPVAPDPIPDGQLQALVNGFRPLEVTR